MYLTSVELTNYRSHEKLKVDFARGFNLIVGVNGSGKTSLLNAVCDVLAPLFYYMPVAGFSYSALSDAEVARYSMDSANGRIRFTRHFPVSVVANGFAFVRDCSWKVEKASALVQAEAPGEQPGMIWRQSAVTQGPDFTNPVLVFYRATRHWNQGPPNEMLAVMERSGRSDGFKNWSDGSLDGVALQSWVVAKSLERFQTSSEKNVRITDIRDDELALVNVALAAAVDGASGLRFDVIQKSVLMDWQGSREPTPFQNLSDGQRAVIGLVADIARRMCLLNPHLGSTVMSDTPGIVLIDELDLHLHPQWQRRITKGLKSAFPLVQFIVTSHSPQIIGELQPEEIILLRNEGTEQPAVSYGLDSSRVLEEVMGAEARSSDVEALLSQVFTALERNDLQTARGQLAELKKLSPGIAEIPGAEALLKRKEVIGR